MPIKDFSLKLISDCKLTLLDQNDSVDVHAVYKALLRQPQQQLVQHSICPEGQMNSPSWDIPLSRILWDQRDWSSVISVLLINEGDI